MGARLWVTRETTRVFFALTISFVLQNRLLCETQVWKRVRLAMAFSFPRPYNHKFTKEREGVAWCTIPRACPSPACGRGALLRHAFVALRATWLPVRYRGSALHVMVVDSCYRVAPGSPQDSQFDRNACSPLPTRCFWLCVHPCIRREQRSVTRATLASPLQIDNPPCFDDPGASTPFRMCPWPLALIK